MFDIEASHRRTEAALEATKKTRQLYAALTTYLSPDRSPKRIVAGLVKAHDWFAESGIAQVQGLGAASRVLRNELQSFLTYAAKCAESNQPITEELIPDAAKALVAASDAALIDARASARRATLASDGYAAHTEEHQALMRKNAKFASRLPNIEQKGFGFARVPVVFTTNQGLNKHAGIGWLNKELVESLGFSIDVLDGYAVLNNQIVLGVDSRISKIREVDLTTEQVLHKDKKVTDRVVTFKGGRPEIVDRKRAAKPRDFVDEYIKLLNKKTNVVHTLVSERAHGHKGDSWFWIMPARDLRRLARAFPGGAVQTATWGFAF
jgi:hypothetical protein